MKTYSEFMSDVEREDQARLELDRADRTRFVSAAQVHTLPDGLVTIEPARTKILNWVINGTNFPTLLTCDRCDFQLVWTKDASSPRREVCCAACGWTAMVPRAAQIGTDWPGAPEPPAFQVVIVKRDDDGQVVDRNVVGRFMDGSMAEEHLAAYAKAINDPEHFTAEIVPPEGEGT